MTYKLPPNCSFIRSNLANLRTQATALEFMLQEELGQNIEVEITPGYFVDFFSKDKEVCYQIVVHKHVSTRVIFLEEEYVADIMADEDYLLELIEDIKSAFKDNSEVATHSIAFV